MQRAAKVECLARQKLRRIEDKIAEIANKLDQCRWTDARLKLRLHDLFELADEVERRIRKPEPVAI